MSFQQSKSDQQFWVVSKPKLWRINHYTLLTFLSAVFALMLTMLIPHDQRRLHMPEPWSYALAAQNFAQGNWYSL